MSIASELTNLEGNIEDSYDAVNDMGGVIPAQKNMDNLDQAIRTIPQNQGTTYTAGNGIDITNDVISIDDTVVAELSDLPGVMTGATSSTAGTSGLTPAPAVGDQDKFLKGDGTWATVQSGTEVKKFYIDNDYIFRAGTVNQEILDAPGGDAVSDATLFAAMKDGLVMIIANSDDTDYESAIATNAWMDSGVLKFTIYGSSSVDSSIDVMQVVSTGGGYYDFDGYDIVPKNGTLTIKHNGTNVQTFTANSSTNKTANVETIWADPIASSAAITPLVQTSMIADGAVTADKLGAGAVTSAKLDFSSAAGTAVIKTVSDMGGARKAIYYADGTLITVRRVTGSVAVTTAVGSLYHAAVPTGDYWALVPVGNDDFIEMPIVQITPYGTATQYFWIGAYENSEPVRNPSTTGNRWALPEASVDILRATTHNNVNYAFHITAIGRWK